ncbi:hypothetical protein BC937DRAFT_88556 [Endogone sp. FLAS-F59071]|nr:hypothetical protein BC937DRAFT_88556 [Endogone sp. FLAS-F59071]|eukprot:RUS18607.1 hypothetical protein BC937DRAFT_88556 [Endogone sp. FLAS-F59071]
MLSANKFKETITGLSHNVDMIPETVSNTIQSADHPLFYPNLVSIDSNVPNEPDSTLDEPGSCMFPAEMSGTFIYSRSWTLHENIY